MSDNKKHIGKTISAVFQSKISKLSSDTALKYRRSLSDFDCFLNGHRLSVDDITDNVIADWATEQLRQGFSRATVIQRLNILNSLFKSTEPELKQVPLPQPREIAKEIESDSFVLPLLLKPAISEKCLSILHSYTKEGTSPTVINDILLFSILNVGMPLEDIIYLPKENSLNFSGFSEKILRRNISSKRKFVFDLKQSYRTKRQIVSYISAEVGQSFNIIDLKGFTFEKFASSLWVILAMRCGALASEAAGISGASASYAVPDFHVSAPRVSHADNVLWAKAVETLLIHDAPKWYALHLRKGVHFDDFRKDVIEKINPVPELFYPVETIKKQLGGKTTVVEQPFISRIVFFKSNPENVLPMFASVGDKAWCIRTANNAGAPYAVIPHNEMLRFQNAIGVFSADSRILPLGSLTPQPGEKVILIHAGYANREATVEDTLETDCGTAIFRVKLTTDYGYEWRTTIESRHIERIVKNA